MKRYAVTTKETYTREHFVEAEDADEAELKVAAIVDIERHGMGSPDIECLSVREIDNEE